MLQKNTSQNFKHTEVDELYSPKTQYIHASLYIKIFEICIFVYLRDWYICISVRFVYLYVKTMIFLISTKYLLRYISLVKFFLTICPFNKNAYNCEIFLKKLKYVLIIQCYYNIR